MTDEQPIQYDKPFFKAAGKNSFFEVFDALEIGKIKVAISLYDETTRKTTAHVEYYLDYEKAWALSAMVLNNTVDAAITARDGFPAYDYGIPSSGAKMREITISPRTERNRYVFTITEKERRDKWDRDLAPLAKASFYLNHLDLIIVAKKIDWFISKNLSSNIS